MSASAGRYSPPSRETRPKTRSEDEPASVTMMSGRWPPSWLNQTSIMWRESRIVPCTTLAPSPAAWSLIMFSHVTPFFGPKYFLFGRA